MRPFWGYSVTRVSVESVKALSCEVRNKKGWIRTRDLGIKWLPLEPPRRHHCPWIIFFTRIRFDRVSGFSAPLVLMPINYSLLCLNLTQTSNISLSLSLSHSVQHSTQTHTDHTHAHAHTLFLPEPALTQANFSNLFWLEATSVHWGRSQGRKNRVRQLKWNFFSRMEGLCKFFCTNKFDDKNFNTGRL